MINELQSFYSLETLQTAWGVIKLLSPIWIPLIFLAVWFDLWIIFKRREYIKAQGGVLLEVKIPREMLKSPTAMEVFMNTLYQPSVGSLIDVYYKGKVRAWFSLELVSIDGEVHFYIWASPKFKSVIESQLYAQFPNIEVHETKDYAMNVHYNPERIKIGWIGQFALSKADAYPIKSYIDYGLDKDPKEEYKHDPIVPTLEFLGSLKKGEQAWIQILIQGHTKEGFKYGRLFEKPDWKNAIEEEVKSIIKKGIMKTEDDKKSSYLSLSDAQKDVIKSIERNAAKPAFETMIRAAYIAENDAFNPNNIGGLLGSFKQFGSNALNSFKPGWKAGYDYPWQDFKGIKKTRNEKKALEAFKRRAMFNTPFKNFHGKPFILTSEELATLWHFPSFIVASTPTLSRLPSKKAEAPSNLPV